MTTIVPIIIPQRHEVNCIIQAGVRYCENEPLTKDGLKAIGLVIPIIVLWLIGLIWCVNKAMYDEGFMWLLPLGYFLLPFILMVLL